MAEPLAVPREEHEGEGRKRASSAERPSGGGEKDLELQPLRNSLASAGNSRTGRGEDNPDGWTWMRFFSFFPKWLRLVRRWFAGNQRKQAWLHAVPCVVLAIAKTLMVVKISYVQRRFSTNLSEKNADGFYAAALEFVWIILMAAPLFSGLGFAMSRLKLVWRKWMTDLMLDKYFKNESYFKLKMDNGGIDNPDQRICDDIASFTSGSATVMMTALDKVLTIVAVLKVLWEVSPELVAFVILYSILGTIITVSGFGKPLTRLFNEMLHREGDMRFTLVRVAENAESIAFYGGAAKEHSTVGARLKSLVEVTLRRIHWLVGLDLWTNCYGYATILVPSLMIGPQYFKGEVDFGTISQAGYLFNRLLDALSAVVDNLHSISSLATETDRLHNLIAYMEHFPDSLEYIVHKRSRDMHGLHLQALTVATPRNTLTLSKQLSVEVKMGQSVLIVGASGCGKSSLMRAVAGLWNTGSGVIETPEMENLFFLPQKPFMPLGTLRQQLLFPSGLVLQEMEGASLAGRLRSHEVSPSDSELLDLLEEVHLSHLPQRVGGLDTELDWAATLSQGEQQRIAFLRLLLHRPEVAFLDEATAAVDNQIESELYRALQRHCKCYISIGHRSQLLSYHTHVLYNVAPGKWEFMTTEQYQVGLSAAKHT